MAWEETSPADTLSSDLQAQESRETKLLLHKPPSVVVFMTAQADKYIQSWYYFVHDLKSETCFFENLPYEISNMTLNRRK